MEFGVSGHTEPKGIADERARTNSVLLLKYRPSTVDNYCDQHPISYCDKDPIDAFMGHMPSTDRGT